MRLSLSLGLIFLLSSPIMRAQPCDQYMELPDPCSPDISLWSAIKDPVVGWGSTDHRYPKSEPVLPVGKTIGITAWIGERVSAQFTVSSPEYLPGMSIVAGDLLSGRDRIDKENVKTAFVRYVMTDEPNKDGKGCCGYRNKADFDSSLVADVIDPLIPDIDVMERTTRPCWVSINVPKGTRPGIYSGRIKVLSEGNIISELKISLKVRNRELPPPQEWKFHLDLWQNPYAVARYYGVEPFSDEHFELMRPVMQLYSDSGGKVITSSIISRPWNGQTYDPFASMVTWLKRADGTWYFDYTAFDRWVEFMMSLGIDRQINCYSMIPWQLEFQYIDQATGTFKYLAARPGESEYAELWVTMLKDFAAHLKDKGWFDITHISMDERPLDDMLEAIKVVRKADVNFKLSLAGTYHDELAYVLDDYCITLSERFPGQVLSARRTNGNVTTFYTCCTEVRPNTFTFSDPAEAEWMGWHCAYEGLDGYLRWAFNSWVENPLQDSRFTAWAAGDTYLVYPGGRTSIRMARLRDGIQAFEKIRILKDEFMASGDGNSLKKLEYALSLFDEGRLADVPASEAVRKANLIINDL